MKQFTVTMTCVFEIKKGEFEQEVFDQQEKEGFHQFKENLAELMVSEGATKCTIDNLEVTEVGDNE